MIWHQFLSLAGSYPLALRGLGMTVVLSLISLVLGTLLGFGLGILRTGGNRLISGVIGAAAVGVAIATPSHWTEDSPGSAAASSAGSADPTVSATPTAPTVQPPQPADYIWD